MLLATTDMSFNSLQTGRHIQTTLLRVMLLGGTSVSIPFKREGTFRHTLFHLTILSIFLVSIPFKREGTFRPERSNSSLCYDPAFQFPSNGKAHSDSAMVSSITSAAVATVSIPFKREGTFRHSDTRWLARLDTAKFQFPSNGKAHSDKESIMKNQKQRRFNSLQTGRHIQTFLYRVANP